MFSEASANQSVHRVVYILGEGVCIWGRGSASGGGGLHLGGLHLGGLHLGGSASGAEGLHPGGGGLSPGGVCIQSGVCPPPPHILTYIGGHWLVHVLLECILVNKLLG